LARRDNYAFPKVMGQRKSKGRGENRFGEKVNNSSLYPIRQDRVGWINSGVRAGVERRERRVHNEKRRSSSGKKGQTE